MKRILAILLALLLAFVVSYASNGTVMDRTADTRTTEAAMGYYARCGKHTMNLHINKARERKRKMRDIKKRIRKERGWNPHGLARRVLLAPLALMGFGFSHVAQAEMKIDWERHEEELAFARQRIHDAKTELNAVNAKLAAEQLRLDAMEEAWSEMTYTVSSKVATRSLFTQRARVLALRQKLAAATAEIEKRRGWLKTMMEDDSAPLVRTKEEGVNSPDRRSWAIPEIAFQDMFGDKIASIVKEMDDVAAKNRWPHQAETLKAERARLISKLWNAVLDFQRGKTPNEVCREAMATTRLAECGATDIACAVERDPGDVYAAGKLRIVHALKNFGDDADNHVLRTAQRMEHIAINIGVSIDGAVYRLIAATPSQSKAGDSYFAEYEFFAGTRERFWRLGQKLSQFKSNGSEELKRMALAFTPSVVSSINGGIKIDEIVMLPEVNYVVNVLEALVFELDGTIGIKHDYKAHRTLFDGAIYGLVDGIPSYQLRSAAPLALKGLYVNCASVVAYLEEIFGYLPETITDIDGNVWALPWSNAATKKSYPVAKAITTTSTWKGKSLGLSWSDAVAKTMALKDDMSSAEYCRVVRYADAADERPRKLGRQALQEFISWTGDDLRDLMAKPIGRMMAKRHLVNQMVDMGAIGQNKRSYFHKLVEVFPELLLFGQIRNLIWTKTESNAEYLASARVPINGDYPYITEDPVVALAHLLYGMSLDQIKTSGLFYLRENEASFAGFDSGHQLFTCRYPLNWFAAQLLTNRHHRAYTSLGGVGILSAYGIALIAMDGDVDGDETLVTEEDVVLRLAHRMLRMGFLGSKKLPVIVFPHDTECEMTKKLPFENELEREFKLSVSLDYSQRYSTVGIYANAAAAFMAAAAEAWTNGDKSTFEENALNAAIMHVASILVIDMTKTGAMPDYITQLIPGCMRSKGQMPWCQRFNLGWTNAQFADDQKHKHPALKAGPTAGYLPDAVAYTTMTALNSWRFDDEGLQLRASTLQDMLFDAKKSSCGIVINRQYLNQIIGLKFKADDESAKFISAVVNGDKISLKDTLVFFWRNESALRYKIKLNEDDLDFADEARARLRELHILVYNLLKSSVTEMYDEDYWQSVVNYYVDDALKQDNGVGITDDPEDRVAKQARYAMFVLEIFAPDLLANVLARR